MFHSKIFNLNSVVNLGEFNLFSCRVTEEVLVETTLAMIFFWPAGLQNDGNKLCCLSHLYCVVLFRQVLCSTADRTSEDSVTTTRKLTGQQNNLVLT